MAFSDIPDALQQISAFVLTTGSVLPADISPELLSAVSAISPVDRIAGFGRAIHDHRALLDSDTRSIGAAAIAFAAGYGWHGLDIDGPAMIAALETVG